MCHGRARGSSAATDPLTAVSSYGCAVLRAQSGPSSTAGADHRRVNRTAAVGGFLGGMVVGFRCPRGRPPASSTSSSTPTRRQARRVPRHSVLRHHAPIGSAAAQEFTISSAGFWVQNATNEWLLTKRPRLRLRARALREGRLRLQRRRVRRCTRSRHSRKRDPPERDTRGMAVSSRIEKPWIGAIVLAPAVFDTWRYFDPDSRAGRCGCRAPRRSGAVLLVLR